MKQDSPELSTLVDASVPAPHPDPLPDPRDVAVDAWFATHFHNMGALLDTPVLNLLRAATEDLKQRLRALP